MLSRVMMRGSRLIFSRRGITTLLLCGMVSSVAFGQGGAPDTFVAIRRRKCRDTTSTSPATSSPVRKRRRQTELSYMRPSKS